jgi:subtilisin family serine protease
MLSGVQFAVENGANIISMSLGFKHYQVSTAQKEAIRSTFDNVLAAGVIVCAAAGNDGNTYGAPNNVDYPAACPSPWNNPDQTLTGGLSSVVCVGAYDLGESSRGPSTWEGTSYNDYAYNSGASMGLIRPDISAPGYLVYSLNSSLVNKYNQKSGTSQATPCVAGVMALMLEKNSAPTPAQITEIIETTASNKPAAKNNSIGAGRIDALAAVNAVTEGTRQPFLAIQSFTPTETAPGAKTISITLKNEGKGSCLTTTNGTLSSDSPFVTIEQATQTI